MIDQFVKVWKSNHGNLLFGLGLVAASLMSAVWYFNLIPDIKLITDDQPVRLKANSNQPIGPVHIQISGPARTPSQEVIHGTVLVFSAEGEMGESTSATSVHPFELDSNGHAFVMFSHSTQSSFAVIAYLDLNSNGKLDFDSDAHPLEPWRSSLSRDALPLNLRLDEAAVTTTQSVPLELRFEFSKNAVANSGS